MTTGPRVQISWNDGWSYRPFQSSFLELAGTGAAWTPVTLPHDAMISQPRDGSQVERAGMAYFPDGAWEYKKSLFVPEEWRGRRVLIEFDGVYRGAKVYVNGDLAAERPYGYSSFRVPLDRFLRYGEKNRVLVRAHTHEDSRWYSGAGIYRDTTLVVTGLVHVAPDGVLVTTPEVSEDRALVLVATTVQNDSTSTSTVDLLTELVDPSGVVVAKDLSPVTTFAGEAAVLRQRLVVTAPQRWDVDTPFLYRCRTQLVERDQPVDEVTTSFGIRSLAVDAEAGLRLNGNSVKLRGACIHHDNGVLGAATIGRAEERRVEILKQAGFNALRSAHHPMSKAMLDACDRVGMLVMDEAFDMWTTPKTSGDYAADFPVWWQQDIDGMVRKDINHPSVIMYSIGNEIPELASPAGAAWGRRLAERVRSLDDTRPVTNGVNPLVAIGRDLFAGYTPPAEAPAVSEESGVNTQLTFMRDVLPKLLASTVVGERLAEAFSYLDVAGYNYLESRYELDKTLFPNRVIVGSETQPADIARNWALVRANNHLIGDFTWTGWDYLGEVGVGRIGYAGEDDKTGPLSGFMGGYPWLTAWCGDIDITGHRRPVSYYREIVFGLRRDPYIAVHRPERYDAEVVHSGAWGWSDSVSSWSWSGHEGRPIRLEVYADADEVELLVNGRIVGKAPAGEGEEFKAEFDISYEPGEITAVAYRAGAEIGRTCLRSATGDPRLAVVADRTELVADHRDLAFVTGTLVDADGNLCTGTDRSVTVEVTGPAQLQGFGSASPKTEEGFADTERTTFDGRVLAVVRPSGPGEITVTMRAEGCPPCSVQMTAQPVGAGTSPSLSGGSRH
ncbi:MAG: glycoside hydrolase family 2 TIM barrel-domain containing protein [Mycobacteriales bacterium]